MNKYTVIKIVLLSVIASLLVNIFFGRFISAKVSTLPILNRWKIVSPQAPIVINTVRQERVSDTGDTVEALNNVKSKLSLVITLNNNEATVVGGAINVTSDGWFLVPKQAVSTTSTSTYIKIDGTTEPMRIEKVVTDSATNFSLAKVSVNNISGANFGNSESLQAGQKVIIVHNSLFNYEPRLLVSLVTVSPHDYSGITFSAGHPARTFGIQNNSELLPGEAVVAMNGEVVGVWSGASLVPSDVIKGTIAHFINNGQQFVRPSFGFNYRMISASESSLAKIPQGALVGEIDDAAASPARKAGLLTGDIIEQVANKQITDTDTLEEFLEPYKPGDTIPLSVWRKGTVVNLTLVPSVLK